MSVSFDQLKEIVASRRTVKPQQMNGGKIPDEQIGSILALADFAPNHGNTEPWRFVVYSPEKIKQFCTDHAMLYRRHTPAEKFEQAKYDKLLTMGDKASHVVVAIMQRGSLSKIPVWEEQAATACAIEHILLGATALGIASYWGSGGMAQYPALKTFLNLREEDFIMGILYFGYANGFPQMIRTIPMEEKINWV